MNDYDSNIEVIAAIILSICCLPAMLFAILIYVMLNAFKKVSGWILSIVAAVMGFAFFKSSLLELVKSAVYLFRDMVRAALQHTNIFDVWKSYLFASNFKVMFLLGVFIAGIFYAIQVEKQKPVESVEEKKAKKEEKKLEEAVKKITDGVHPKDGTIIGADIEGQKVIVEDKAKHIIVAGTTGAGKTVTISNLIESAFQKGYPVLSVDGKGDMKAGSMLHYMQEFSKKYGRKLYVINFVQPECSDLYNPFKDAGRTEAKDMLISMNTWSEEHYKVNTERYLQMLIKMLNIAQIPLSLNTIIKYLPEEFKALIEKLKNDNKISIEEFTKVSEIIESSGDIAKTAMARFATTSESEAGEIFSSDGIDIYTAIKEGSSILIILDSLGKPELSQQVGRLAVIDAKKAVSKLFGDDRRKFFIFDEFNVYVSDAAVDLLNKSRSANVTCTVAFQSLSDLDKAGGKALRNQVIENCNNYIIMRQNSPDSSNEWQNVIGDKTVFKLNYGFNDDKTISGEIFGNKTQTTGGGSMHEEREAKFRATEIQNLKDGQAIYVSKDKMTEKKIKVRYIGLDTKHPNLVKRTTKSKPILNGTEDELIKLVQEPKPKEVQKNAKEEMNFEEIENFLNQVDEK